MNMKKSTKPDRKSQRSYLPLNQALMANILFNTTQTREALMRTLLNPNIDINYECGYPETIEIADYKDMWDREGYGKRVVTLLPEECWTQLPEVYETEDAEKTD